MSVQQKEDVGLKKKLELAARLDALPNEALAMVILMNWKGLVLAASKEPMVVLELEQVEIDHCLECQGIWLDAGELEILLGDHDERERLLSSFQLAPHASEKPHTCPICLKKMMKVWVGHGDEKILIDECRKKDGLWFDSGELKQIIALGHLGVNQRVFSLVRNMVGKEKEETK